jgi:quercetin dioxygenase-like cupin family protein
MLMRNFVMGALLGVSALFSASAFAGAECDPGTSFCTHIIYKQTTTWDGAPAKFLRTKTPEVEMQSKVFRPRIFNNPHIHRAPLYIYLERGQFQVNLVDGRQRVWNEGEAFPEVVNTIHTGGNPSYTDDTKLVIAVAGKVGLPFMDLYPWTTPPADPNDDECHNHRHGWFKSPWFGWPWWPGRDD